MRQKTVKRVLSLITAAVMVMSSVSSVWAAPESGTDDNETEILGQYSAYEPGVTVEEDENSPTGYTATFIYDELDSYEGLGDIVKVEMYSDCMMLFETGSGTQGAISPDDMHAPEEYQAGMNPAGGSGNVAYYVEMTEFADGLWAVQVPLTSGAFVYNFQVTDADGNVKSRLDDPSNPTLVNSATGIRSLSSMVYVPYNAEKQGSSTFADRTVENPAAEGSRGTVQTVSYEGADGTAHGLAVYLPNGYDANRAEPYNVLYLSHGTSGDIYGDELRWMNEGAVANIMDNLAADFVVVTMNNQQFGQGAGHSGPDWLFSDIETDQIDYIMPYVESNYNVSKEASGRAYAGLSMGGSTTSNFLMTHPEMFGYYGIWSYANTDGSYGGQAGINNDDIQVKLSALAKKPEVMIAAGTWDFGYVPCMSFGAALENLGYEPMYLEVPAAHDWENWQLTYAYAVKNFFFQKEEEPSVYENYEPGVTVEEDENSPTGYTATFIYKELESYDGLEGALTKVELYSDCMMLFETGSGTKGRINGADAIPPENYVAGLNPAGGNAQTTYYKEMEKFGDGLWGCQVPLPSGATVYNFRLTDENGTQKSRTDDPSNPTLWNTATNIHSLSSMVYVPYNAEKMGTGEHADRTVENKRTDGQTGTVETIAYTGANDDTRGLAVYLPYGYDAEREEPYKVLYLSHGNSGDRYGNELRWMNEGAVANIMDNLIAEGKTEPFVVVTMNNQDLGWNYGRIWDEQQLIFDRIESDYNVSAEAEGRAFAGLSMGGITTSNMYLNHGDEFSYYGVWSAANTSISDQQKEFIKSLENKHIMVAGGYWDSGLSSVTTLKTRLAELGIECDEYLEVPGAHDWETWQMIYAYAAENFFFKYGPSEYDGYEPGVTVEEDENSPTGYTATFIYKELESYDGLEGALTKVELYSDCMMLFETGSGRRGAISGADAIPPENYVAGLNPAGGNAQTTYYKEMEKFGDGLWGCKVPLPSGATVYNFRLTDENGTQKSRTDDPSNPTLWNTATNIHSLSSMVYVPYNEAKMGTGEYADRTIENPRTDDQTGTVETIAYTGANDDTRGLAVYLPYGYDEDREEPYNVLYLSHGSSGDQKGNELRWMNEGAVANIMDNLIAEGKIEPFVVVTMNNQDLGWNINRIWAEQQIIMPLIEEKYNVSSEAAGRAFAGLSAGGRATSQIYLNHAEDFSYFGVWSYADANAVANRVDYLKSQTAPKYVMVGAGYWDYLLNSVENFEARLAENDLPVTDKLVVPAAHDWETWQMLYAYAAENFFFQYETGPSEYDGYEPGVTVEEDENSPTGYTATFIFDEACLADIDYDYYNSQYPNNTLADLDIANIAEVQIYSNTALLFSYDEQAAETPLDPANNAHDPSEYAVGMYPAGGDTTNQLFGGKKINYYGVMEEFANGKWGLKVPLTSGATDYNIRLIDADGSTDGCYFYDPANPPMKNTASGIYSRSSMVYVPFDSEKQGVDRSVENPRTDGGEGTQTFAAYTAADGSERYIGIHLPNGFDAEREEPYKVLYMSHGAQSEPLGSEMRWLNECAVSNIADNLDLDYIIVTMNNIDLSWNLEKIWGEMEKIFDFMEENYNASVKPANRAFAGFSMGGQLASRIYVDHADEFGWFGIWSYADVNYLKNASDEKKAALKASDVKLSVGAGTWDYLLGPCKQYEAALDELGIAYSDLVVEGSHDWRTWQLMAADAFRNFFFMGETGYEGYEPGVTVEEDENSPTGYTATFIYKELESYDGLQGEIAKVELYSDCMMLFETGSGRKGNISGADAIPPENYVAGLNPAGGNGNTTYYKNLTYLGGGLWGCRVPLPSGATVYNFRLTDENGTQKSRTDDPSNPTLWNTATNIHSLSSMVYVPYNAEKMGDGEHADRTVENPRTDGQTGTVETIAYTGANNDTRGLAVYLPYGYDAEREEPYKVLYLSHGNSGDRYGNELRWMHEGAVANIMDNLIAEGKTEPFVVVTMNNQDLGWNYNRIWAEQELIFAEIEGKYNVTSEAKGRAFAGLSMGGMTTSNMYLNHGDEFGYYGVWSAATTAFSEAQEEFIKGLTDKHIMLAGGYWDFGLSSVTTLGEKLAEIGIESDLYYEVPGAHDWETWQMIYAYAAENFFFKLDKEPVRFADVMDENKWYYDSVYWAVDNNVTSGYGVNENGEPLFQPLVNCNRAQAVTFLYNYAGKPAVEESGSLNFTDVAPDSWYHDAVAWAVENGITSGYGTGTFQPNATCTRAMIVTFLANYAKYAGIYEAPETPKTFTDVKESDWFYESVSWAATVGITSGYGTGTFQPKTTCNRAMMVTFIKNMDDLLA